MGLEVGMQGPQDIGMAMRDPLVTVLDPMLIVRAKVAVLAQPGLDGRQGSDVPAGPGEDLIGVDRARSLTSH